MPAADLAIIARRRLALANRKEGSLPVQVFSFRLSDTCRCVRDLALQGIDLRDARRIGVGDQRDLALPGVDARPAPHARGAECIQRIWCETMSRMDGLHVVERPCGDRAPYLDIQRARHLPFRDVRSSRRFVTTHTDRIHNIAVERVEKRQNRFDLQLGRAESLGAVGKDPLLAHQVGEEQRCSYFRDRPQLRGQRSA